MTNVNENEKNKPKQKNIKENIKEAIAMAKEKTKQKQIIQNKENGNKIYNNNAYKNISNIEKDNRSQKENNDNNIYEVNFIKKEEE